MIKNKTLEGIAGLFGVTFVGGLITALKGNYDNNNMMLYTGIGIGVTSYVGGATASIKYFLNDKK